MSSCTIYLKHLDPVACVREITNRAASSQVEVHFKFRKEAGDEFSRLILGTHNFFRTRAKGLEEARRDILQRISEVTVIVGIPRAGNVTGESLVTGVSPLAEKMDAMFFDGFTMRDGSGIDLMIHPRP